MASVIRGSGASTLGGALDVQGVLTYEDVTSVDSIGIITARSGINVGTGASIFSPDTNELTLGTNNVERLRIASGGNITVASGTLTVASGNIDTGDILNAVGGVRTNVDGSLIINPASSLSSTAQRFILYKDRSSNTDTAVVFTKAGRADFAGRVFSNEWFQSDRTTGTDSAFYATLSGVEKLNIRANGSASFAAGAFAIESDGDISTNVKCHGHIELDSTGVFSSPKIKLFSNTGNVESTGHFKSTNTGIAYLQPNTVTAFQAYESSGPVKINLNNNGSATFA